MIYQVHKDPSGWWRGTTVKGNITGSFPGNFVEEVEQVKPLSKPPIPAPRPPVPVATPGSPPVVNSVILDRLMELK